MRAIVDQDLCTGCGLCPEICPEVFKMVGDLAVAYIEIVPKKAADSCKEAADQCPASAISIES